MADGIATMRWLRGGALFVSRSDPGGVTIPTRLPGRFLRIFVLKNADFGFLANAAKVRFLRRYYPCTGTEERQSTWAKNSKRQMCAPGIFQMCAKHHEPAADCK